MKAALTSRVSTADKAPVLQHPEGNMTVSQTPSSVAERRLAIARRLFRAMVAKDPDRSITLFDSRGEVVARHDPRPEQSALDLIETGTK